jgi:DNA repair protein RecN (Recombination protein N)
VFRLDSSPGCTFDAFGYNLDAPKTDRTRPEKKMRLSLCSLRIRNLALVEELHWDIARGFTVVTGETGSGKSIIVGALKLLVGEKADRSLIRFGADQCTVEAVFDTESSPDDLNASLENLGIDPCSDGQLLIKRSIAIAGSHRQFVNGSPTTLGALKQLGNGLLDLHGPHDHQSLFSCDLQRELLDAYAGNQALLRSYQVLYRRSLDIQNALDELCGDDAAFQREIDLLEYQSSEISNADIKPDEDDELSQRHTLLSQSKRIQDICAQLVSRITDGDSNLRDLAANLGRPVRELERLDPSASEISAAHVRCLAEIEDLADRIHRYSSDLESDPAKLVEVESRQNLLETLKRKYGPSLEKVIAFGQNASERLHRLLAREDDRRRLQSELHALQSEILKHAADVSQSRAKAASNLSAEIVQHLRDLGFPKPGFRIGITHLSEPGQHGIDAVDFQFAPNPGEPEKPLRQIASSGEISRVMLALKSALAGQETVPLLVFDEIDANVGGEIANAVGRKMRRLGQKHQVICISHLPQVACCADRHFVVSKETRDDRTLSNLIETRGEQRIAELARMLGGKSASALSHARELLELATND